MFRQKDRLFELALMTVSDIWGPKYMCISYIAGEAHFGFAGIQVILQLFKQNISHFKSLVIIFQSIIRKLVLCCYMYMNIILLDRFKSR